MLLYHNEIRISSTNIAPSTGEGILVCRSSSSVAGWHYPNATPVPSFSFDSAPDFFQIRSSSQTMSTLVRSRNVSVASLDFNGLWTCRENGNLASVGLHQRGMGEWPEAVSVRPQ